jgi:hypothetical protein
MKQKRSVTFKVLGFKNLQLSRDIQNLTISIGFEIYCQRLVSVVPSSAVMRHSAKNGGSPDAGPSGSIRNVPEFVIPRRLNSSQVLGTAQFIMIRGIYFFRYC